MFQFALLVLAFLIVIGIAVAVVALLAALLMLAAIAAAIGIPTFFLARHWSRQHRLRGAAVHPLDRLKTLYVEGKIDLFEFERRVAHLIAVER
jgi:hypothetical protein